MIHIQTKGEREGVIAINVILCWLVYFLQIVQHFVLISRNYNIRQRQTKRNKEMQREKKTKEESVRGVGGCLYRERYGKRRRTRETDKERQRERQTELQRRTEGERVCERE